MRYEPIVPEGQHLGTSREVAGAVTGHLFEDGTNELRGHAAWRRVDEPEPRRELLTPEELELAQEITKRIYKLILVRIYAVAEPHVKRWWNEEAVPAVKSAWERVTAPRK